MALNLVEVRALLKKDNSDLGALYRADLEQENEKLTKAAEALLKHDQYWHDYLCSCGEIVSCMVDWESGDTIMKTCSCGRRWGDINRG